MAVRTKWLAGIEVAVAGIEGHLVLKLGCFVWGSCAFYIWKKKYFNFFYREPRSSAKPAI